MRTTAMWRRTGRLLTGAAISLAVLLTACSSGSETGETEDSGGPESAAASASDAKADGTGTDSTQSPGSLDRNAPEVIAGGLEAPWSIAFVGDTPLVSERDSGRILEISSDGDAREVARLDEVAATGEAGLHGLAVHDDQLYAFFAADAENRIERFDLLGEAGHLSL